MTPVNNCSNFLFSLTKISAYCLTKMSGKKDTLMKEVEVFQDLIRRTSYRIDILEKELAEQTTLQDKESLKKELESAKKILKVNEKKLLDLKKDNSRSFMIAACIIYLIFVIYGVYLMVYNNN